MPRDPVSDLFSQLARTELPVPARSGVIARGQQRRRRTRLLTVVLVTAALLCTAGVVQRVSAATSQSPSAAKHHNAVSETQRIAGFGPLVLGVNRAGQFFIARAADMAGAHRVTRLPDARGFPPLIGTGPDGWVISYAVGPPTATGSQPEQLAIVRAPGVAMPFGPVFQGREYLTSLAVRPDGSAVAVGIAYRGRKPPPAMMELIPMPGGHAAIRTWRFGDTQITAVESLSWTPDGSGLTYVPGTGEGDSFSPIGAVTLKVGAPGSHASARSRWPQGPAFGCPMFAGTWSARQYVAEVACDLLGTGVTPANPVTGSFRGRLTLLPSTATNCSSAEPVMHPAPRGEVLLSLCDLLEYNGKRVLRLPGPMLLAAYEGAR
jgi:hypothetical protein